MKHPVVEGCSDPLEGRFRQHFRGNGNVRSAREVLVSERDLKPHTVLTLSCVLPILRLPMQTQTLTGGRTLPQVHVDKSLIRNR